ncbi:DUF4331 domain-containing protein [Streptosporangium roseum]|uniref:DUF4331 domain-containing protein n=1 Tax=Streptosporangium roseum (strain ATCC 12428 / DSM 43021 / JCM 3005 / KCTC 9067 / NCIMB 10171 / NRRL 2505 / NI 9100) TaxID=479432 RepID=D2B579_STRRD|nr:DUF4331 domain-containing protein [Streptosporangium roseum]ACZ87603.1 conserved hypothetical protein [Streptosporangium roseum DSM 43021]
MQLTSARSRWTWIAGASIAVLTATVLLGPTMRPSTATSHWDAPATTLNKQIDATDLYAFTSPERQDTVTIVANYIPFQAPHKPYQFDTDARYEVHIDNTGTGKAAVTYRWTFANKGLPVPSFVRKREHKAGPLDSLVEQSYTLTRLRDGKSETLVRNGYAAPTDMGALATPNYPALRHKAVVDLPGGGKVFTGTAADPFYSDNHAVNLLRFGLPFFPVKTGVPLNVSSLALQLPKSELALGGDPARNPVIGVWTTASRKSSGLLGSGSADYKQVSRLGNPNFNEVIIPLKQRDHFNTLRPDGDESGNLVVPATLDPDQAKVVAQQAGVTAPPAPRKDLEQIYLTGLTTRADGPIKQDLNSHLLNQDTPGVAKAEELRLNMSTPLATAPDKYGILKGDAQGYPNGRRLIDDVVTVNLRMLLGEPAGRGAPGLIAEDNPAFLLKPITGSFPYLALPVTATG